MHNSKRFGVVQPGLEGSQNNNPNSIRIGERSICGVDGLLEVDPWSVDQLRREMREVTREGYEVTTGDHSDKAYEEPGRIRDVFNSLSSMDRELSLVKSRMIREGVGGIAVSKLTGGRAGYTAKQMFDDLEPTRNRLLFDSNKAHPWHDQRGRALALETIWNAFNLNTVGSSGEFNYMSGELDADFLEYTFGDNAPDFDGMSLPDAILKAEMDYSGKTEEEAADKAYSRIKKAREFVSAEVTPGFKDVVAYCTDGLGIRTRGVEVGSEIDQHVVGMIENSKKSPEEPFIMMSYGCGTARTIIDAAVTVKENGQIPKIILLDQDPMALAAAVQLAQKNGIDDSMIEIHCKQLFSKFGRPINLDKILNGRKLKVAEDSGLREYLPDGLYERVTKETWRHLDEGGLMSTGNMNLNRPQKEFLHGMMGWFPQVTMRTIKQGFALHEKAGVPKGRTRAKVTRDGVYTLYFSVK